MNSKLIIPGILFLAVAVLAIMMIARNNKTPNELGAPTDGVSGSQEIILFYGDGCPHCDIVEEYLDSHKVSRQAPYTMKEVYYNQKNATELGEKAQACGLPINSIGVPFLWDGGKCYIGDYDIIEFFKLKANIK